MIKRITANDNFAQQYWEAYRDNLTKAVTIDSTETHTEKAKRIKKLEANHEAWFKYYFPHYCTAEPAQFHIDATDRWMNNSRWYEVRAWSRELAKSARAMMEDLKLLLTKECRYKVLISHSWEQAVKLFMPYMIELEDNPRIKNDYGKQQQLGSWNIGDITTKTGFSIVCFGAGQSPRGIRKEQYRPDILDFDDTDTDEIVRNAERVKVLWKWIEKGVIPTMSVSGKRRIRFNGNVLAKLCIITLARKMAKYYSEINIRDKNGKSSWHQKNSEEDIDYVLSEISYAAAQGEYFNTPIDDGDVIKEIKYGKCPPINTCDAVLVYADPATSNKDKSNSSSKYVGIVGRKLNTYYVYKVWLDTSTNARFIDWLYGSYIYLKDGNVDAKKIYIENNSLQDPFYEQVLLPLIHAQSKVYKFLLPITPDTRKKPEKFYRIEASLEPLNRLGLLVFNSAEKDDPHMQRMEAQMIGISKTSKLMDGPDGLEGGVWILANNYADVKSNMHIIKRTYSKKRI